MVCSTPASAPFKIKGLRAKANANPCLFLVRNFSVGPQFTFGFEPVSPILRSPKVSGRAVQRRLYASVPTVAAVSWLLSDVQAQLFEGWFEHVLVSGTSWFECQFKTPMGLDDYEARFTDIYSRPTLLGVSHWRFTANLELFKRPVVDAERVLIATSSCPTSSTG